MSGLIPKDERKSFVERICTVTSQFQRWVVHRRQWMQSYHSVRSHSACCDLFPGFRMEQSPSAADSTFLNVGLERKKLVVKAATFLLYTWYALCSESYQWALDSDPVACRTSLLLESFRFRPQSSGRNGSHRNRLEAWPLVLLANTVAHAGHTVIALWGYFESFSASYEESLCVCLNDIMSFWELECIQSSQWFPNDFFEIVRTCVNFVNLDETRFKHYERTDTGKTWRRFNPKYMLPSRWMATIGWGRICE